MQNEERINGLETQVRTLKRIVCLVCCVFAVFMFAGCQSDNCVEEIQGQIKKDYLQNPQEQRRWKRGGGFRLTDTSICRNCIEDKIVFLEKSTQESRSMMIETILSGRLIKIDIHSESDCKPSE